MKTPHITKTPAGPASLTQLAESVELSLGDDPDQLVRDLQDRFPKAGKLSGYRWGVERKRELLARDSTERNLRAQGEAA